MRRNECLEAAMSELAKVGIRDVAKSYGSKHLQIRFKVNGSSIERMYSMPGTPSDVRSAANTRADIRRILREDGMMPAAERKPPPAPRPPAPPPTPDRVTLLEQRVATLNLEQIDLKKRVAALEQIIETIGEACQP